MNLELLTVLLNILAAFGTAVFHSTAATTTTSALRSLTGPVVKAVTIVG